MYEDLLYKQELFWAQRAKDNWIRFGDRNTTYFHAKASQRKKRNAITMLKNNSGFVLTDQSEIREHITQHFNHCYSLPHFCDTSASKWSTFDCFLPTISSTNAAQLIAPPQLSELRDALFSMKPDKSPGPDGFSLRFFQTHWDLVHTDLFSLVQAFFSGKDVPTSINKTSIVLIPKKDHPEHITDFRPISLCNVTYKCLAKILVNRLKAILPDLIAPEQSAFVLVLVNGEDSNWFKPTRGLWQGCPLSPYLFILAINALSAMFKAATVENSLEGIRLGTGGPILTHVLYADDLFVFSKATNNDIRALKMLLLTFCELPGDEINYSKSAIIFNRRMSEVQRDAIRLELNINDAPLQGKYLGNPLFLERSLTNTFEFVINRLQKRLTGWKAKSLSHAGRLTLIQSVLLAIPRFYLSFIILPAKFIHKIERVIRDFWWGFDDSNRHLYLQAWSKLTRDRKDGGLGIPSLEVLNRALVTKLVWSFLHCPNSLWAKAIRHKYLVQDFWTAIARSNASQIWKSMLSMRHVLHGAFEQMGEHTRWRATSTGRFTLSSAISYLNRQQSSSLNHGISARTQGICFKIWKLKEVMPRVKLFIWRAVVDALPVGPKLAERIPHFGDSCPLCQEQSETRDHLFFHCLLSQQVWFASQVSLRTAQSSLTFIEWLDALINNERFYEIRAYCMHVLWSIWKARNDYIFQHKKFSCSEVLRNARMWTKLYSKAHLQPLHIPDPATINSFSPPNTICWVDGAWKENRSGGIGYLVVEGDVDVYCCAAPSIDSETALAAEIQAWYEAVKWLLNNRPNIKCSIYTDSTAIIRSCLFKDQHNPFSLQELERIAWLRRLLESNNNILIGWSSRYSSFSQHVDKLAKWCLGSQVASSWSSFTEFEKFVTPYHME
ncbi:uncharacterized protein LOC109728671 [Ananas comosus]|uniref:Uncharacterized protein LOC109728671 n=1 Tax=Ananas comosus TaxID=4615 RepID=A0A6P5HLE7_ANACO|nr:uncharacterized protein LOC109728671 [Ananas comosus]